MELHSKDEIERISFDILKASKSFDIFPTPVNNIVEYSNLIVTGGIDLKALEKKHKSFVFTDALSSGLSKIRGFFDRKEKIIYIDTEQNVSRQGFVKLHEAGHHLLSWQSEILSFVDDDSTLSAEVLDEFEREANYFASLTLFQHDRFTREVKKYELGLPAVLQLGKVFGASTHATFRRYVETSKSRCALLILEDFAPPGIIATAKMRNAFYSDSFLKQFGKIDWPENFGFEWEFIQDYKYRRKHKTDGTIKLPTSDNEQEFVYHFFNNSYNVFVLIFPKGENKPTRTKILLNK